MILLAKGLEFSKCCVQHQQIITPSKLFEYNIYGAEFYKIAMHNKGHRIKKYPHGGWVKLLNKPAVILYFEYDIGAFDEKFQGIICSWSPQAELLSSS